ncbi:hypothetical protein F4808DRAFT_451446 [Astrocystis sublimbata]|nr:hypothetical protein F4808DRAFT_451446 [Astrocystis sublimbata]
MDSPVGFRAEGPASTEDPSIKRPMSHGWRPAYLRRRVIAAFNLVFIISIISLETFNAKSLQQKGLTNSTQSSLYLWTLGPTTAFKNKHWLVLVGILGSMIIRVQIVLSSGLFAIELIPFQLDLPVSLIDHITNKLPNEAMEGFVDYRPYRTDQAILDVGLQYPNFTSPGLVLQQFDIEKALNTTANITEFTVIIDGVSPTFTCDSPPAMFKISDNELRYKVESTSLNHSWSSSFNVTDDVRTNGYFMIYGWEDTIEGNPITPDEDTNGTRYEGSAVMCNMQWLITPTSATYRNGAISTRQVEGATSRAIEGPLLDFLSRTQLVFIQDVPQYIPGGVQSSGQDTMFVPEDHTGNDILVPFSIGTRILPSNETGLSRLMTPQILEEAMKQYHLQHDRAATVRTPICQALVGLFGLLMVLTLPMLWHTAPKDGFLPREPTTLAGLAAILSKSRLLMSALANHGHVGMSGISEDLKGAYHTTVISKLGEGTPTLLSDLDSLLQGSDEPDTAQPDLTWYQPWTLHSLIRGAASIVFLGMIVTFGVLYNISNRYSGIGAAPDGGVLHYSWTLLPSALFVIIRNLALFVALRSELSSFSGLITSFVDQIGLRTLFTALKVRCGIVIGSKSTVLLGALLPIFTSNLFSAETIQLSRHVTIRQDEWIASSNSGYDTANLAAATILTTNLSYPAWTFEDLVFPRVSLANDDTLGADVVVTADIPAVRPVLTCKASIGTSNFEFNLNGTQYTCAASKTSICWISNPLFGIALSDLPLTCDDDTGRTGVPIFSGIPITAYAWAVLICDESFEQVMVTTTLIGPGLEIRDSRPPRPKDSSAEPYMIRVNDTGYYQFAAAASAYKSGEIGFFAALATGRYSAPEVWFRDDAHREDVTAAIKKQHGILRAQGISGGVGARRRFDTENENLTFVEMRTPTQPPDADGEYQYVSQRVVQHPLSSFILLGILTAVLLLHVFITVQSERQGYRRAVPKPPGSIAAAASLFADSDIFNHLPVDAQWMTERKFKALLQGRRFRMGWFEQPDGGTSSTEVYTIREIGHVNSDA